MPNVLKIAMHKNHGRSLFRPAFHIPVNFQIVSQSAQKIIKGISQEYRPAK